MSVEILLPKQHRADVRTHKSVLIELPTPKPCERCGSQMRQIATGYLSCPTCHFQTVEPKTSYWTDGHDLSLMEEAND